MEFYLYRYIQVNENGKVVASTEIEVKGVSIDTEGMIFPEMPTDAIYELYYNKEKGLHYVKTAEFEPDKPIEEEIAQAEMLLMQSEIIANQNAQDEVLAEILLNQMGV